MKNWNFRVYGTGFGFCGLIAASLFGIYQLWKQKTCHNRLQGIQSETIKEVDIFELLNDSKRDTGIIFNVLKDNPLLARNYDHKGRLPLHVELSKSIPDYELGKEKLTLLSN